jgi:hypothetical protein
MHLEPAALELPSVPAKLGTVERDIDIPKPGRHRRGRDLQVDAIQILNRLSTSRGHHRKTAIA